MSCVTFFPCKDSIDHDQCINAIKEKAFIITFDERTQDVFQQINDQIGDIPVTCPLCERTVTRIGPSQEGITHFPLSTHIFSMVQISPFRVNLHEKNNTAAKIEEVIHFKRLELVNIENQGRNCVDGGETYQRLAEMANDFQMLTSAFGPMFGRILYWVVPTSWKANAYENVLKEADRKNRAWGQWILVSENKQTIGIVCLDQIDKKKFELDYDDELGSLKLYNMGVLLHSNFQRRGIVTELSNHIFTQLRHLNLDIDAFFINTRPDNVGVNAIAEKMNFTFIKEMDVKTEGLIPCCSSSYMPTNIYVKKV